MTVVGVDGGNSKTVALAVTVEGDVVGIGRSGCADIYWSDMALAAIREAVAQTGSEPTYVALSLAGADWPEDFDHLRDQLGDLAPQVVIVNDAMGALRAATLEGVGVSLALGIGTALGARAADGRTWHSSFWADTQGARHLGDKALTAVYRAELGTGPRTALTERVLAWAGKDSVVEVLHAMTRRGPHADPGQVAPLLLAAAVDGDPVAVQIVEQHARALGDLIGVAARRVGLQDGFSLSLSGGVLRRAHVQGSRMMRDIIATQARRAAPGLTVVEPRFEPVVGAALLALEAGGTPITPSLLDRIEQTSSPGVRAARPPSGVLTD